MMQKKAKMIYSILEGYVEYFDITSMYVMEIHQSCETFDGRQRLPITVIDFKFTYKPVGLTGESWYDIKIDVPLWVERKYLYRALHELQQRRGVRHNINDAELLRVLELATPLTPWEVLVRETDANGVGV
jgi:hypothetical protein